MGWSGWRNLQNLEAAGWKGLPPTTGLYWVSAVDGSKARSLVRAVRTDADGTLYIGRSLSSIRSRVRSFWACASDKEVEGHIAGWRYARSPLRTPFPRQSLAVSYLEVPRSQTKQQEAENLLWYWKRFGELPPLNFSMSWKPLGGGDDE